MIQSIPYSQALRICRICSEPSDLDEELIKLKGYFQNRDYTHQSTDIAITKAVATYQTPKATAQTDKNDQIIPLTLTYHPNLENPTRLIYQTMEKTALTHPTIFGLLLNARFLTAMRKPKNLRNILCKADISLSENRHLTPTNQISLKLSCSECAFIRKIRSTDTHELSLQFGLLEQITKSQTTKSKCTQGCLSTKCQTCPKLHHSATLYTPNGHFGIPGTLRCTSKEVIYALTCEHCNLHYIGQTSRDLRTRMASHRYNIKNPSKLVHKHLAQFSPEKYRVSPIFQTQPQNLHTLEAITMLCFGSQHPSGLNHINETKTRLQPAFVRFHRHFLHHPNARAQLTPYTDG